MILLLLLIKRNVFHCLSHDQIITVIHTLTGFIVYLSMQGKGEMKTYWLIGKNHSCNVMMKEPLEDPKKESSIMNDQLDELREFSESCLKDNNFKKDKICSRLNSYDMKFQSSIVNRLERLQSLKQNGNKLDRFRRIKSCVSNEKHDKKTNYSIYNSRNQSDQSFNDIKNYHGTSCLNLISDHKEKV